MSTIINTMPAVVGNFQVDYNGTTAGAGKAVTAFSANGRSLSVTYGNAGLIDTVKVDGTALAISNRSVNITGKANTSDLTAHTGNGDIHVTTANKTAWNAKYDKPSGGIPKTDLASAVQTSLGKADTALQAHQEVVDSNPTLAWGATATIGTVGGTALQVTMPANPNSNTKNTTGATNKVDTKLFLTGATSQATQPVTYTNVGVYIGDDNCLYSDNQKVLTQHQDISGKSDVGHTHAISDVTNLQITLDAKYVKPSDGIPKTDLASAVQTSLGKADTALQSVKTINSTSLVGTGNINLQTPLTAGTDYVVPVSGKGLSTNDYTTAEKNKLAGIAAGAEVNVQSDWSATSGDAFIKNKPTVLSSFTNDSGFITKAVNDLTNYYTKSNTYTKTEVNNLISTHLTLSVVSALPTSNISATTIYLVPGSDSATSNAYDEYVYTNSTWEKIGTTVTDLTPYAKTTDVNSALGGKVDKLSTSPAGNGFVKVNVNAQGQVTGHSAMAESDIPTLSISKIDGLQSALNGKAASGHDHDGTYLKLSGGTMTGVLTAKGSMYEDAYNGALNMNNSDIYGLNSIYTMDKANSSAEGIHFYRSNTTVDTIWVKDGVYYVTPNRTLGQSGTSYTLYHTGNLKSEAAAASGTTLSLVTTGEKNTWNNKSNLTIGTTATTAAAGNHTHNYAGSSSAGGAATTALACTGNSATATTLQTTRSINGTNFNGSANITTANWGTSRNIGIVNSDGTGAAVTVAVNGSGDVNLKLPATIKASITGNCSGSSGSCTGNATTATSAGKLQNTAKIGDTNKPVYFTANGVPAAISYTIGASVPSDAKFTDTTYSAGYKLEMSGTTLNARKCVVGHTGNTLTNYWYKVASLSHSNAYTDYNISFKVWAGYADNSTRMGILTAHIRTNQTGYESSQLVWEYAQSGIDQTHFVMLHSAAGSFPCNCEIWAYCKTSWQLYHFDVISEGDRAGFNKPWTLYTNVTDGEVSGQVGTAYTTGLTVQESTLGTLKNVATPASHTHNYAGSSSAGGAATSANKLNTDAGSATKPVYFSGGVPVQCTYELNKSVPADAKFTDTTYSSQAAAQNGTAVSLVTTGEKYTWNNKASTAVVSKTANGLCPQLPNETTMIKYLCQNGTWQVPTDNSMSQTLYSGDYNFPLLMSYVENTDQTGVVRGMSYRNNSIYGNPKNGTITATGFIGNVTGNCSGSAGSVAWANVTGKPTIPTVYNGTFNIQGDGNTVQSFTANATGTTNMNFVSGTGISLARDTTNKKITVNHSNSVDAGTVGTSSATSGSTLAVPYITYDAQGHITATGTHTHTVSGFLASTTKYAGSGSVGGGASKLYVNDVSSTSPQYLLMSTGTGDQSIYRAKFATVTISQPSPNQLWYTVSNMTVTSATSCSGNSATATNAASTATTVANMQLRNIKISTSEPTSSDGTNGDIWIVYEA